MEEDSAERSPPPPLRLLCWWCCHPSLAGGFYRMPYKYDDSRSEFYTCGQFCSWKCMRAHVLDTYGTCSRGSVILGLMQRMYRMQHDGKYMPRAKAPSRYTLTAFGGTLSIEDFRAETADTAAINNVPGQVFVPHRVVSSGCVEEGGAGSYVGGTSKEPSNKLHRKGEGCGKTAVVGEGDHARNLRTDKQRVAQQRNERGKMSRIRASSTLQNETLKLKRTKPLVHQTHNLEDILGIVRENTNGK